MSRELSQADKATMEIIIELTSMSRAEWRKARKAMVRGDTREQRRKGREMVAGIEAIRAAHPKGAS